MCLQEAPLHRLPARGDALISALRSRGRWSSRKARVTQRNPDTRTPAARLRTQQFCDTVAWCFGKLSDLKRTEEALLSHGSFLTHSLPPHRQARLRIPFLQAELEQINSFSAEQAMRCRNTASSLTCQGKVLMPHCPEG